MTTLTLPEHRGAPPGTEQGPGYGRQLLDLLAEMRLQIGAQTEGQQKDRRQRAELLNAIYPVEIPAQAFTVPSSGATSGQCVIASAELLGPRSGNVWDVRRVSVYGLASTSESIDLFRVSAAVAGSAQGVNYLATITGPKGTYSPGLGACLLRPNQSILAYGTGLTTGETITLTGDGVNVEQPWLGAYLL